MTIHDLLLPAIVLVLWTLIMLGWTAATRFPAMRKSGIDLSKARPGGRGQDLEGVLKPNVQWKAHNHTHLHEQPTLFYAIIGALTLMGVVTPLTVGLAWSYTALRIVHSLYQATVNVVRVRFLIFIASTVCLIALAIIALFVVIMR